MVNKLQLSTLVIAVALCSCSRQRTMPAKNEVTIAETVTNTNLVNTTAFNQMVGKEVRLAGALVNAGKGNYALTTTNGLVDLDGYFEVNDADNVEHVVVEGVLELHKAVKIPENFDPFSIQTSHSPGENVPEHYVLRHAKIVQTN